MTKTERVMKWLKDEYGITTEEELDRALERTKLDIGKQTVITRCKAA